MTCSIIVSNEDTYFYSFMSKERGAISVTAFRDMAHHTWHICLYFTLLVNYEIQKRWTHQLILITCYYLLTMKETVFSIPILIVLLANIDIVRLDKVSIFFITHTMRLII